MLTGKSSLETAVAALRHGTFDYLTKPCKLADLEALLRRVAEKRELTNKYRAIKQRLDRIEGQPNLIGQSAAIEQVRRLIAKVAPTDSTVLILGETGTGKELVARAVHQQSLRAEMPLVPVNCGALPEHLIESELFGHRRGAFTGADEHRTGLLQVANGGTLFLDEIGELPKAMQAKMLRFLESGEVRRVGENDACICDVRVICATNRNLAEMVASGDFREDLWFRVNTFEIPVPPLRERVEDIPILARHLAARFAGSRGAADELFASEALEALMAHSWPGNVRELANVIEHAMILCDALPIQAEHLPQRFFSAPDGCDSLPSGRHDESPRPGDAGHPRGARPQQRQPPKSGGRTRRQRQNALQQAQPIDATKQIGLIVLLRYPNGSCRGNRVCRILILCRTPRRAPCRRPAGGRVAGRWRAWILFVALLVGLVPFGLFRTCRKDGCDFWLFYDSAQYIWEYGARAPKSKFLHYLPSIDVAFASIAWLPMRGAAVVWCGLMTAGWLCLMANIRRYLLCDYDPTQARQSVLTAGLVMMPLFIDHLCVGAFHILMVWFMVAGLGRIAQNKPWSGGILMGLAVWVKLLPLLGIAYLLLKRKWLPVIVAGVTVVVVDLSLSLIAYGPQGTYETHCLWLESEVFGSRNQLLSDRSPLDDDRITNQSIMVVMRHTLTHLGQGTEADRTAGRGGRTGRARQTGTGGGRYDTA